MINCYSFINGYMLVCERPLSEPRMVSFKEMYEVSLIKIIECINKISIVTFVTNQYIYIMASTLELPI